MPGGWMIGLGAGLQGAAQGVDLYARMREAGQRTEIERQQQAQQALYQQQQIEIAKRAADINQAQWTAENAPWGGIVPPSVQDLFRRTQMEQHMRVDPSVGASLPGTGLQLPTGLPGGRGGPSLQGGPDVIMRPPNEFRQTPSGGMETPFPTGMGAGPTIRTPSTPTEETGGRTTFVPTETSKLRNQLANYEAQRARAEEANRIKLLQLQQQYELGQGRLGVATDANEWRSSIAATLAAIAQQRADTGDRVADTGVTRADTAQRAEMAKARKDAEDAARAKENDDHPISSLDEKLGIPPEVAAARRERINAEAKRLFLGMGYTEADWFGGTIPPSPLTGGGALGAPGGVTDPTSPFGAPGGGGSSFLGGAGWNLNPSAEPSAPPPAPTPTMPRSTLDPQLGGGPAPDQYFDMPQPTRPAPTTSAQPTPQARLNAPSPFMGGGAPSALNLRPGGVTKQPVGAAPTNMTPPPQGGGEVAVPPLPPLPGAADTSGQLAPPLLSNEPVTIQRTMGTEGNLGEGIGGGVPTPLGPPIVITPEQMRHPRVLDQARRQRAYYQFRAAQRETRPKPGAKIDPITQFLVLNPSFE